jgi:anti-sigma regulatory factor (Ser/Thr protein kinase)
VTAVKAPLARAVCLPGTPVAAGCARTFITKTLRDYPDDVVWAAGQCVSELVTNSLLHSRSRNGGRIGLMVEHDGDLIRVSVSDDGAAKLPHMPDEVAAWDAEDGRGLRIVDAVAARWKVERRRGATIVWFELDLPDEGRG